MQEMIPDYFPAIEFERCTPSCDKNAMSALFLKKLNSARHMAGVPFILNSAYRSPEWDKKHGRSGRGYHTKGHAVDVRCIDADTRYLIIKAAISCGLNGIGVYRNFIHLDDRPFGQIFNGEID